MHRVLRTPTQSIARRAILQDVRAQDDNRMGRAGVVALTIAIKIARESTKSRQCHQQYPTHQARA